MMVGGRWAAVALAVMVGACGPASDPTAQARIAELERALAACEAAQLEAGEPAAEAEGDEARFDEPAPEEPNEPASAASRWSVVESPDDLTGRPVRTLTAFSETPFELDSPYEGLQRARLIFREHPRFGTDVMLAIDRGQFRCYPSDCRVDVVFDGGDPVTWRGSPSDSGSSTVVFLTNQERFQRRAGSAREIRVAATLYRAGMLTFVFPGRSEDVPGSE